MKKVLGLALGILTAIGGFLDIGDLVNNAVVGSWFGLSLGWAVVVGVIGICIFAPGARGPGRVRPEQEGPRAFSSDQDLSGLHLSSPDHQSAMPALRSLLTLCTCWNVCRSTETNVNVAFGERATR